MRPQTFNTLFVVQGDPPPEREADYHRWYDLVHGPDAIENGSFREMRRYRAVGPGRRTTPFLVLWNADYADEAAAWSYIRPQAENLRAAGRIDDIASAKFALTLFAVPADDISAPSIAKPILTTVQNDWRYAKDAAGAEDWWTAAGLEKAPAAETARLYTSDPAGKGFGHHLALFEQTGDASEVIAKWTGIGTPGSSPNPPYRTIFTDKAVAQDDAIDHAPPSEAWTMHWELITALP